MRSIQEFLMNWPTPEKPAWMLIGLPLLGAIVWSRYRQRLIRLLWTVHYQPLAFASEDKGWGKVEILYNSAPTTNLHIAHVRIQNASSRDLQQVLVDIEADIGTLVLRSAGQIQGSLSPFPHTPAYQKVINKSVKTQLTPQETAYWWRRSGFIIPVLNRNSIANLTLLLSRQDYQTPTVTLCSDHLGVRLSHTPLEQELWGVRLSQAMVVGLIVGIAISVFAAGIDLSSWAIAGIAWASGASATLLGAFFVRTLRTISNLAD